jgi:RimJ/RimL family protein N-acetyltransferase
MSQPTNQIYPTFLSGATVQLCSLELTDLDLFWHWFADREVVRYSLSMWLFPTARHETQQWLERTIADKQTLTLGIVETTTGNLIGFAGLTGISLVQHSAEYFILIGNKHAWGKGYGTEVTRLIVAYGFASLNLHRIALSVSQPNQGGIIAYTRAGFRTDGVLRDACYRDGAYHDKVLMAILRPEWEAQRNNADSTS